MAKTFVVGLIVIAASATSSLAAQDYCGRITSLPDGFVVKAKGGDIFFAGDNSMPPDPKGVYDYLNANHKDSDRGCYCISGDVKAKRFASIGGLSRCGGATLR